MVLPLLVEVLLLAVLSLKFLFIFVSVELVRCYYFQLNSLFF